MLQTIKDVLLRHLPSDCFKSRTRRQWTQGDRVVVWRVCVTAGGSGQQLGRFGRRLAVGRRHGEAPQGVQSCSCCLR